MDKTPERKKADEWLTMQRGVVRVALRQSMADALHSEPGPGDEATVNELVRRVDDALGKAYAMGCTIGHMEGTIAACEQSKALIKQVFTQCNEE